MQRLPPRDFGTEISNGLSCVVFGSKGCSWCEKAKEAIDKRIADKFSEFRFYEFHVRALGAEEIKKRYDISSIPVFIIFQDGKEVDRLIGFAAENNLIEMIKKSLEG